ncbi:cytochrome c maturation protein CcmE [Anaplasma bovis]|uniref:cytochrome c maturation protein CcmE n=1 Tax=Anaplasma bovis TaxID=186733 RepID=UPI002FF05AA1
MKRKHRRTLFVVVLFLAIGCIFSLVFFELSKNMSFFYTTSELLSGPKRATGAPIRVGGIVVTGSVVRDAETVAFEITDLKTSLRVVYSGILPPLFREGVGAVVKGTLKDKTFVAEELLAKHDERYMPKTRSGKTK